MSGVENLDVMLGAYSRDELRSKSVIGTIEVDLESNRTRVDVVHNSDDFESFLNSNSREKSESTVETMRLVSSEVSKKMDELKRDLFSQIIVTINSVISEKILPNIRKYYK